MHLKYLNRALLAAGAAVMLALSGCQEQQGPSLRIQTEGGDGAQPVTAQPVSPAPPGPEVIQQINANTQVVTGEAAITEDKPTADDTTTEDKTGAVAVKMKY